MLPEASRRKCTNTLEMIRSFVVDRLRCGHPGLSCRSEGKTWMPGPTRARLHFDLGSIGRSRFLAAEEKRWADPCPVMDGTVSAEG